MPEVIPLVGQRRFLIYLIESAGPNMRVVLFKNNVDVDHSTEWVTLEEADFSGYERQEIAWGTPYLAGFGYASVDAESVHFIHDGGPVENVIYGYAILDTYSNTVLYGDNFDPPALMSEYTDSVDVTPLLNLADAWDWF